MSSRDVEDLVVRARPEGLDETTEQFEGMEEGLDDVSGSMGETAGGLQSIQNRMQGAMGAIVAGVAVATGFLLTQVPIIGELVAGFGAVLEILGFRLDGLLRPALGGVVNALFDLSGALAEADGPMGALLDAALLLGTGIAAVVAGFLVWVNVIAPVIAILTTVGSAVLTAATAVATFIAGIISIPVVIGAILIALAAFVAAWLTNWRGTRDTTNRIVGELVDGIVSWFSDLVDRATGFASDLVSDVLDWFRDLRSRAGRVFGNLIDDAASWGSDLIDRIVQGIRSAASGIADAFDDLPVIGDLIDAGVNIAGVVTGGAGGFDLGGGGSVFGARRNVTEPIFMDGRRVDNVTGRYGKDRTVRRGGG